MKNIESSGLRGHVHIELISHHFLFSPFKKRKRSIAPRVRRDAWSNFPVGEQDGAVTPCNVERAGEPLPFALRPKLPRVATTPLFIGDSKWASFVKSHARENDACIRYRQLQADIHIVGGLVTANGNAALYVNHGGVS